MPPMGSSSVPMQHHQQYYQSAPLTVDTSQAQQKYFEADDNDVLDENILDRSAVDSGLELSPPMADSRRESFALGPPLFSPKTEGWHSVDMQSIPSNNPFDTQTPSGSNPFAHLDQTQTTALAPPGGWSMNRASASASTMSAYDGMPNMPFDGTASMFSGVMQNQNIFANAGNPFSFGPGNSSIPTSPQKEWISGVQSSARKSQPDSPTVRSHNDLRRGDGIRKKNARFEIPAERNLGNIDKLISLSTDEQELKELKQQKRLLRNRQAALDSRQRKKQHTERLEDEKKQFTAVISDMEDEVNDLRAKMEQLLREKQSYNDYIETLALEKEEMIRSHTIETGELRKKVGALSEHVQRLETQGIANSMSSANKFPNAFEGLSDMPMAGDWGNTNFLNFGPEETETKPQLAITPAKKSEDPPADGEKNASQGGLLFLLFLVGAFVMSGRSTPAIPPASEDVRAASATLLDNVLKDAGVRSQSTHVAPVVPQPSIDGNWPASADAMDVTPFGAEDVSPSMLGDLGDSLTRPTQAQANEQIFSLSAAQYNGVGDQDFLHAAPERSTSQGRRNLAEALAAMRTTDKQNGAADVYTRSLLWDQIPSDVVRNFAKMVADCNASQDKQQCNDAR